MLLYISIIHVIYHSCYLCRIWPISSTSKLLKVTTIHFYCGNIQDFALCASNTSILTTRQKFIDQLTRSGIGNRWREECQDEEVEENRLTKQQHLRVQVYSHFESYPLNINWTISFKVWLFYHTHAIQTLRLKIKLYLKSRKKEDCCQ